MDRSNLGWQSKLILLLVVPYAAVSVALQTHVWSVQAAHPTIWVLGLSALLGLLAWKSRSGTPAAAMTGALLTASIVFSTLVVPYRPWHTALVPVITLLLLTSLATRFGRKRKEILGTAEKRHGRGWAQVAANVGLATLLADPTIASWVSHSTHLHTLRMGPLPLFAIALAAIAEAAADTLSSEIGQVLGGQPRMLTTLRAVAPGTDGGITFAGSAAGILAAGIVALAGSFAIRGGNAMFALAWSGAVFGLFFDSLLGATLERRGWLNNDAVNFLSTASAAGIGLALLSLSSL